MLLRILIGLLAVLLIAAIIWAWGADDRGLGPVLAEMVREPWTVVTLIDLYLGFVITATIIIAFEDRLWKGVLLAAPTFVLGNFWPAAWLIFRLPTLIRKLRAG